MNRYLTYSAKLSECGLYRYCLERVWSTRLAMLTFVMLNPSAANGLQDDPTIRKCVGFAGRLGFGSIRVVNLFAFRATSPKDLKLAGWPQGPDNQKWLIKTLMMAPHVPGIVHRGTRPVVVVAWGANARGRPEAEAFKTLAARMGVPLFALKTSPDGTPHHPLMLPYASKLEKWPARPGDEGTCAEVRGVV